MLIRSLFASILLCLAGGAQAAWHQAKSKHFIIYANESEADLRAYAEKLERFDQAVRYFRRIDDPPVSDSARVTIFVLPTQGAIEKLSGYKGVRGFYLTKSGGSYAFVPRRSGMEMVQGMSNGTGTEKDTLSGEAVFFHEYAHHLQLQDWTGVMPAWVSEGFAEFFASTEIAGNGNVTIGKFPSWRSYEVFVGGGLSAEDLVQSDFDKLGWYEGMALYGRSWLLTHYLSLSGTRNGQLSKYLAGLEKGTRAVDAGRTAFGDLKALSRDMDAYAARRSFLGATIDAKMISPGQVTVRALTAGEADVMPALMRVKYGLKAEAGAVAAQARSSASRFPGDVGVQNVLAEAELRAQNYAAAQAAAERVLSANPANVQALIFKGRAQMALARNAAQPVDWEQIRSSFLKANKIDTENAEPLLRYFESYADARQWPSKNAIEALLYAVDLAPQDEDLRLRAVLQLLADKRGAEAKAMLAPLSYDPHQSKEWREEMPKIIEAIDGNDPKQAQSLLEQAKAKKDEKSKH